MSAFLYGLGIWPYYIIYKIVICCSLKANITIFFIQQKNCTTMKDLAIQIHKMCLIFIGISQSAMENLYMLLSAYPAYIIKYSIQDGKPLLSDGSRSSNVTCVKEPFSSEKAKKLPHICQNLCHIEDSK